MTATIFFVCLTLFFAWLIFREAISMTITRSISGIISASETVSPSDESQIVASPTIPAAKTGILTTRTNNTSGEITMDSAGHGISTGDRVDLFWADGQCYGAVVGTVAGAAVPIASVAGGSNLPAEDDAITVCKCVDAPFGFTGDNLTALAVYSAVRGYVIVADGSTNHAVYYLPAGRVDSWDSTQVTTNPVAGDTPTKAWFSHAQTSGSVTTMKAAALVH